MQFTPSLDEIRDLREQGNLCPIYAEIMADLETPVSAFLKIARGPHSFLLESVTGGQHIGRYSFIGSDPYLVLRMHAGIAQATQGGYKQTMSYTDPLLVLDSYLSAYRPVRLPNLPIFVGGAVGYLAMRRRAASSGCPARTSAPMICPTAGGCSWIRCWCSIMSSIKLWLCRMCISTPPTWRPSMPAPSAGSRA